MTVAAFFGCALTAYGPVLAMFSLTIAKDPVRVIILILRLDSESNFQNSKLKIWIFSFQRLLLVIVVATVIDTLVRRRPSARTVGLWPCVFNHVSRTLPLLHLFPPVQGRRLPQEVDGERADPDFRQQAHLGIR